MTGRYILATSCAEADRGFADLRGLAMAIVGARDAAGGDHAIRLTTAQLARDGLPGGRALAVRLADGADAGRGTYLGYAILPLGEGGSFRGRDLMEAIEAAADTAAQRRAA